MQSNNLSAPDQLIGGELSSSAPDFQEIFDDHDSIHKESVYQSVPGRRDWSETSFQTTSQQLSVDNAENQPKSLNFNSLLVDNSVHNSGNSNYQSMSSKQESLRNQRVS